MAHLLRYLVVCLSISEVARSQRTTFPALPAPSPYTDGFFSIPNNLISQVYTVGTQMNVSWDTSYAQSTLWLITGGDYTKPYGLATGTSLKYFLWTLTDFGNNTAFFNFRIVNSSSSEIDQQLGGFASSEFWISDPALAAQQVAASSRMSSSSSSTTTAATTTTTSTPTLSPSSTTTPSPTGTSPSLAASSSSVAIAIGVGVGVGVAVGVLVGGLIYWWIVRRRRRQAAAAPQKPSTLVPMGHVHHDQYQPPPPSESWLSASQLQTQKTQGGPLSSSSLARNSAWPIEVDGQHTVEAPSWPQEPHELPVNTIDAMPYNVR